MRRIHGLLLAGIVFAFSTAQAGDGEKFFNGKDLAGFEGLISDYWSVKDGAIVGSAPKGLTFNTFLCSSQAMCYCWLVSLASSSSSGVSLSNNVGYSPSGKHRGHFGSFEIRHYGAAYTP